MELFRDNGGIIEMNVCIIIMKNILQISNVEKVEGREDSKAVSHSGFRIDNCTYKCVHRIGSGKYGHICIYFTTN